jgi:glyoxylase-like metal-dependent hydrolase (beta-lactamase superfamily II)
MSVPAAPDHIQCISVPTPYAVGPVNCYLLDGPAPALVDCGPASEEAEHALREGLHRAGIRPRDLALLVLTHHHPDHAGGLGWLRAESGAVLCGHPRNDRWLGGDDEEEARNAAFFAWLYRYCDATATATTVETTDRLAANADAAGHARIARPLVEGDVVDLGYTRWHVYETPGHAGSSISMVAEDGTSLVGDTLLHRISSNALAEPGYPGEGCRHRSLPTYRQSLARLAAMDLALVLPGHGPSFTGHKDLIARRLRGQDERARRLLESLRDRDHTVLSLAMVLFPGLPPAQLFLGLSEVLGHLDLLEDAGLAAHEGEAPARYYARSDGM